MGPGKRHSMKIKSVPLLNTDMITAKKKALAGWNTCMVAIKDVFIVDKIKITF